MSQIDESIASKQVILIILNKNSYSISRAEIINTLQNTFAKTCMVTTTKPYSTIVQDFANENVDASKFYFIDTITKTVQDPPKIENGAFVESPTALTDISLAFSDAISNFGCEACLIDTISTLVIYQDIHNIIKLVHNLVTKARVSNKKIVFIALKEDGEEFIKDISLFMDEIVEQ